MLKRLLHFWGGPAVLLGLWEIAARAHWIDPLFFPPPTDVAARLANLLLHSPRFLPDIGQSVRRLLLGSLIAIPAATAAGLFMGLNAHGRKWLYPLVSLTYPLPKIAMLPFLMIVLGIADAPKIALIAVGMFYLVTLTVLHAVCEMPQLYLDIARVHRMPRARVLVHIILKGILPDLINGCKIGMGYGLVMVVGGEMIAARNGIGFYLWNAWDHFQILDLYAAFTVIGLLGALIFFFFDTLLSRIPWRPAQRPARNIL